MPMGGGREKSMSRGLAVGGGAAAEGGGTRLSAVMTPIDLMTDGLEEDGEDVLPRGSFPGGGIPGGGRLVRGRLVVVVRFRTVGSRLET